MKYSISGIDISNNKTPDNISDFSSMFSLNSGNLLFHYAAELIVELDKKKYSWHLEGANEENGCFGVLLPMANHINSHMDLLKSGPRLSSVDVPVIVMGIGAQFGTSDISNAQEISPGTIEWLKEVSATSRGKKNISVRGRFTRDILAELGFSDEVEVIGCQSNFINPDKNLGKNIYNKFKNLSTREKEQGICVTAGDYHKKNLHVLERSLISMVEGKRGAYIVQNPKHIISLANGWHDDVPSEDLKLIHLAWLPQIPLEGVADWFKYHSSVYISVPQWLLDMSKRSMAIGTRIHGIQAALQAGTPSLCLCIDSRTKELCSLMALPHVDARKYSDGITFEECFDEFEKWDYLKYDEVRLMLAGRMKKFLINNGAIPSKHLLEMTS